MLTAVSPVPVVAFAPPVFDRVGGLGEGSTPFAVAWPLLVTVICAWNVWPRLRLAGSVKVEIWGLGGVCPVMGWGVEEAPVTARPELASVPAAPAVKAIVPAPVPFSVYVQVKVAVAPPA